MNIKLLNSQEVKDFATQQLFSLENGFSRGDYYLKEVGDLIPGAVMVHEIEGESPNEVTYMNDWGCEQLGHSMDEINAMGDEYYRKFFLPNESPHFIAGMADYYRQQDYSDQYCFFHQVRTGPKLEPRWFYAVCKFFRKHKHDKEPTSIILVANPVAGMSTMINKINKVLDQDIFINKNYKKFASLTKREKEIIILLAEGKSSPDISDLLFISKHTVNKHRRNIIDKLEINSFAELLKFAIAFELVHY